ncbi:glycosyltransferase family 4 protein [uncultured Clostridium sp.]|uniref:glycosyltransferase family 4 protein n=1 Tax=Clostridium sp. TaxID=1506 RepID=UPI00266F6916|nr:glycosyltransferase family 4 protein [uncultured Clostridium sp.]
MKKQKVLIVHNYYQTPGGEDTVVENEKNLLINNGHEVVLYTRHNDEIKTRGIIRKLLLPLEAIFSIKTYKEVKRKIIEENIDIVHVHNTLPLISPSVYYSAFSCKVPVVQTIHNFRLLCPGATFTRGNNICEECVDKNLFSSIRYKCYRGSLIQSIVSAVNLAFHRLIGTYKKVNGYIALTEFNKEKLMNLIDEKNIYIKPNFVNKSNDTISKQSENYFLFLGRLDELKGIQILIEIWKDIKDINLVVIGKGPLEVEISEFIEKNKLNNVNLLGYKNKEEVMRFISKAKALIVPSQWYEGFPMTIAESLSMGVPVIAGDIGNLSTIIESEKNGLLFKYNDKQELKDKIQMLNNNKSLEEQLRQGARESFNNKYNERINYKLLIDIYENCSRRNI